MLAFSDAHLDIAWSSLTYGRDFVAGHPDAALGLPDLLSAGVTLACATIFSSDHDEEETPQEVAEQQFAYYEALPGRSDGKVIWPADAIDVGNCTPGERICLTGLLEGCEPLKAPEDMATYHQRGVRVVGLTHNKKNRWAAGCNSKEGGLTAEGASLVKEMDRLGMVHDVSHLSRTSLEDLLGTARGPVIASHVGSDAVHADARNLTDDHMQAISQRGGVVALVLFSGFLADGRASFDDAVRHLLHMIEVCGVDHVGLGTDFDGGFGRDELPTGIRSAADLPKFADALFAEDLAEGEVAKICGGNLRRVLTSVM
ncbi:MAG: dipeptidase [Planctomycetota bacterium]|jgi:membrane dipeptidase